MRLNAPAPDFELPGLGGETFRLGDYRGRIVVVNFWSAECPHSERTDRSMAAALLHWDGDVVLASIASNRSESVEALRSVAAARHLPIVLLDAQQAVADLYNAQTTPHVFVVDRQGLLRYRGAVDDVTFRQRIPTRFFLEQAVEALLGGRLPDPPETPAYGCTIVREG